MMIQCESLRTSTNSIDFRTEFRFCRLLGFVGVLEFFFETVDLIQLHWREKLSSVCGDVDCDEWILLRVDEIPLLTCTVVAFYRLPHVLLSLWQHDTWM